MPDQPLIIFRVGSDDLDIKQDAFGAVEEELKEGGIEVKIDAVVNRPCSGTWAEVVFEFVALAVAKHYFEIVLKGFDSLIKRGFDSLGLQIRIGGKQGGATVPLRDDQAARKAINKAFFDLAIGIEQPERVIYWLDESSVTEDGKLMIVTAGWQGVGHWSMGTWVAPGSDNYDFWIWVTSDPQKRVNATDLGIMRYWAQYAETNQIEQDSPKLFLPEHLKAEG